MYAVHKISYHFHFLNCFANYYFTNSIEAITIKIATNYKWHYYFMASNSIINHPFLLLIILCLYTLNYLYLIFI